MGGEPSQVKDTTEAGAGDDIIVDLAANWDPWSELGRRKQNFIQFLVFIFIFISLK